MARTSSIVLLVAIVGCAATGSWAERLEEEFPTSNSRRSLDEHFEIRAFSENGHLTELEIFPVKGAETASADLIPEGRWADLLQRAGRIQPVGSLVHAGKVGYISRGERR
jgi:hypothetical protein